jgi:glucosyl-dolichyl phosphate glucuronosyltransferase
VAEPVLSVVICTHDRHPDLAVCLRALAMLEDPVEVVVVDSGSSTPCEELVRELLPSARYAYESRTGLSRARNRGVAEARCALVAFVDDDAAPEPDWAGRVARAFANAEVGCVGGTCAPAFSVERPRWLSDRLLQYAGITDFPSAPRAVERSRDYPFGANVAFRRDAVLAAGGFREELGRTGANLLSGEEAELVDRLRAAGWTVWIQPDAVVRHAVAPERCRRSYYWRRLWWQGISRARAGVSPWGAARLLVAAPVRLALWAVTRDRVHLYRVAETGGFIRGCLF